jgi:uncharacterized membrane protein
MAHDPDPVNAYAPPTSDADEHPFTGTGAFEQALFSPKQIGWAAFFGSMVAGILLLMANYRAMGRPVAANKTVVLGLLATAATIALVFMMPKGFATPLTTGIAFGLYKLAASLQGDAFFTHWDAGGARRSNWMVFGVAAATAVGLLAVMAGVVLAMVAEAEVAE